MLVSLLMPSHKYCKDVNDPILLGIVPDRLLTRRSKRISDDNDPILLGIVPVSLLVLRSKTISDDNDPILFGIVPVSDRPYNEINITLSYVADPLTAPHVTP